MNLFTELKRRNVFRVALFYIVAAWVVIQVAETVLPMFDVSDGALRAIVIILSLGFPLAVVFAWAFELTPEGLKRDRDARVDPEIKQQTAHKLNWATLIAAGLAIGLLVADRLMPESAAPAAADLATGAVEASPEAKAVEASGRRSIAVLPFINMSPDPDNAYFADGISEELLNILAGIDGLTVASRTSAFTFRGDSAPIPEIAAALGVRYVLEGSVRKQGERVRITSQLIDAESDAHLWSETYERELTDIFRVQENIARSITNALTGLLIDKPVQVDAPTNNLEAYQHFLRGRSLFYQRVSLDEAIRELRRAVALDADFAQAWAFLGAAEYVTGEGGYPTEMDQARLMQRADESIERALALDDAIPIAQAAQGQLLVDSDDGERIASGLALLKDAAAAVSPDSTPKIWYGISLLQLGDIERAFEVFEQAHSQDPLVAINNGYLGVAHAMQGRRDEGARYALRALELSGELTFWVWLIVIDAANAGDIEQAAGLMSQVADSLSGNDAGSSVIPMLIEALGQGTPYSDWLERDLSAPERLDASNGVGNTAMDALILRDLPAAIEAARQSQWVIRFQLIMSAWMPSLLELREDPAFFDLMTDTGYVDYWRATRFPLGCRPIDEGGVARLECGETP